MSGHHTYSGHHIGGNQNIFAGFKVDRICVLQFQQNINKNIFESVFPQQQNPR